MKRNHKNRILVYLLAKTLREECHNAAEARAEEVHNVGDMDALDADSDGWFKVSPYGVFPGKTPGRPQHLSLENSRKIEEHFNSWRGKMGRMFRGAPIFIGHPDVDRAVWPDERRLGKITEVQARADGLWARAEWNALGRENIDNGYWIYPSPRWDAPAGQGQFMPDRLLSIGLTNMPRIVTSEPIANAEHQSPNNQNNETMDRKILIEKLGLPPEATDEEILAKLDAMLKENADAAAAEKAKLDAEAKKQGEVGKGGSEGEGGDDDDDDEDDELKKARMDAANARVDLAIAEGRISMADRATWLPRLTGENREAEANALSSIKPKLNTGSLDLKKARAEVGDEAQRRETIANAVAAEQGKGKTYAEAYNAVRANPEFKAVFDAMKEPGREE
jgi:phage I-like protein